MPSFPKSKRPHWIPERKPHERRRNKGLFNYNSKAWRIDRAAFMGFNPICAECERKGQVTPASVCDHIIPISQGGDPWDWDNRQALCDTCHAVKSGKEAH